MLTQTRRADQLLLSADVDFLPDLDLLRLDLGTPGFVEGLVTNEYSQTSVLSPQMSRTSSSGLGNDRFGLIIPEQSPSVVSGGGEAGQYYNEGESTSKGPARGLLGDTGMLLEDDLGLGIFGDEDEEGVVVQGGEDGLTRGGVTGHEQGHDVVMEVGSPRCALRNGC